MERFCISMSENDVAMFEAGREAVNMSKSAYVRLLIAEHENRVPEFIKYKSIIEKLSETNHILKELQLKEQLNDKDVLQIYTMQKSIEDTLKGIIKK